MKIALIGDVALFGRYCIESNPDVLASLDKVSRFLSTHDLVIANLETPFSDTDKPLGAKSAHIRSASRNIEVLKYLGVTHVTLANNHVGDFGVGGYELTKKMLDAAGIGWFGIERRQIRIEHEDVRIALLGYCSYNTNPSFTNNESEAGVNVLDVDRVLSEMSVNAEDGFLNIVAVHSGQEHVPMPSMEDIRFARGLAGRFNYVYYGHHPHVIQGVEQRQSSPIFYSLGNFLFDDVYTARDSSRPLVSLSESNKTGLIASLKIENNCVSEWDLTPIYLDRDCVTMGKEVSDFSMTSVNSFLDQAENLDYSDIRQRCISDYIDERKSRRDLKWYIRRLNLNSLKMILNARRNTLFHTRCFTNKLSQLD